MAINGVTTSPTIHKAPPKITLYTFHNCPFAQRVHITLDELRVPYEEVIIDLKGGRPQWYLDIYPRGLVPAIKYSDYTVTEPVIIAESDIITYFLCDSFPSHLLPTGSGLALLRARIALFSKTWSSRVSPAQAAMMRAETDEEKEAKRREFIAVLEKDIEPLLADADPFFGGSTELTLAEVFTAPFVMRLWTLAEYGEMVPTALLDEMAKLPKLWRWMEAIMGHGNATSIFDKEVFMSSARRKPKNLLAALT